MTAPAAASAFRSGNPFVPRTTSSAFPERTARPRFIAAKPFRRARILKIDTETRSIMTKFFPLCFALAPLFAVIGAYWAVP
jgi:hypothetical protein